MRRAALTAAFAAALATPTGTDSYRGIEVAPERRCAPYDRDDYRYSQSVEARIVASIGRVYGPYTGRCFGSARETDIEHMVAVSEAHDSGLCGAPAAVKSAFASDLLNLTLAAPGVNRHQKSARRSATRPQARWMRWRSGTTTATAASPVRRCHGIAPVPRGHPAYRYMRDGDGDGIVCE